MKKSMLFLLLLAFHFSFSQTEINGMIQADIVQKKELGYALHLPSNLKEKKPLIIFLHGDGEKGTDIEKVKIHGPFSYLKSHTIDAYVLAPQCRENEKWSSEILFRLIQKIQKEYNIDANKIYLTGLSSGGWATWNLALEHPDLFAALVPIASFVDLLELEEICKLKSIPIKIFHGLLDDVVTVDYPTNVYKALKKCDANVRMTIFDDANHNSWTRVYDNQDVYDWMFQQVKKTNIK